MPDTDWDWVSDRFQATALSRADGSIVLRPTATLGAYPERVTDPLEHWAARAPDRVLVARRDARGAWSTLSYGAAAEKLRALASGLTALGLSAERPLLILSGNGIEHLLLSLAAMYAGVPYCPVSTEYSRAESDRSRLRHVIELLTPGLVASLDGAAQAHAIGTAVPADVPVVCDGDLDSAHRRLSFAELEHGDATAAEHAHAKVTADTIAKFLLTSGSTGRAKPVITTHRMLSSNQLMLRQALPFVIDEPPVLVDWLPWNHTFGGSHNVGLVIFNGGTLYIDDGRPVPGAFELTLANLREISPTIYFSVPRGFELLAPALDDDALRRKFFQRLRTCFFAGASLAQHTWDRLDRAARRERGRRVPILSGLGATETGPAITFTTPDNDRAGVIGLPAAGNDIKLTPVAGKLELRVRGPHVTPGYWRMPEQTAAAFDEEGYYRLGDAVRLVDTADAARGMIFDGRLSDDFKLTSGTWVRVGPLHGALVAALAPLAQDVIIAGLDHEYVGALIVPDLVACREVAGANDAASASDVLASPILRARLIAMLRAHAAAHPGSSQHAERAIVLEAPLSSERGELTDKGSVVQRTVLQTRAALIAELFADPPPGHVLQISS